MIQYMSTKITLGIAVLVVLIGGIWYYERAQTRYAQTGGGQGATVVVSASSTPSALLPVIHLYGEKKATSTSTSLPGIELKTGDEVSAPTTLELSPKTSAVLLFPDGSEARLGMGTRLVLNEAVYTEVARSLGVSMELTSGRVWSKILELATPESHWEVKTSNAVATVRGTAFDVRYAGKQSSIFTASREVAVSLRDPITKRVLVQHVAAVKEGKLLLIGDQEVALAQAQKIRTLPVLDAPTNYTKDAWVTSNKQIDTKLDERVELLRKELPPGVSLPVRLRDAQTTKPLPPPQETVPVAQPKASVQTTTTTTTTTKSTAQTVVTKPSTPIGLEVLTQIRLGEVSEGETIAFRALLLRADGSTTDVTNAARWQVIGPMGRFSSAGSFVAELDPSLAEMGEGSGSVVAVWRDALTGEEYLGKSPVFKVVARVIESGPGI